MVNHLNTTFVPKWGYLSIIRRAFLFVFFFLLTLFYELELIREGKLFNLFYIFLLTSFFFTIQIPFSFYSKIDFYNDRLIIYYKLRSPKVILYSTIQEPLSRVVQSVRGPFLLSEFYLLRTKNWLPVDLGVIINIQEFKSMLNNSLLLHLGITYEEKRQLERAEEAKDDVQAAKIFSFVFIIAFVIVPLILIIGLFTYKLIN